MKKIIPKLVLSLILLSGCVFQDPTQKLMNQSSCIFVGDQALKIINGKGIIDDQIVILEFSKIDSSRVSMKINPPNVTLVVSVSEESGFLLVNFDGQKDFVKCKL